ncbi:hypothetical protein ACFE04_022003 [Oxalis oulophora]
MTTGDRGGIEMTTPRREREDDGNNGNDGTTERRDRLNGEKRETNGEQPRSTGKKETDGGSEREKVGLSTPDSGKGKSKMSKHVTHGFHLVKGKSRHPMEDYVFAQFKQAGDNELGLFAIFDGHLSHVVPDYLQTHLFQNILNEPDFWTQPENAIRRAYRITDTDILDKAADLGRGGDVPRVDGQLAVARAFGDKSLKEHLSSEPDVFMEIIDDQTEFIILASDGLWKVMSNQEAADAIKDIKDARAAAKHLSEEAINRKSSDDISCIVVRF